MKNFLSKTIATFFGAGYFPVAPGTFASLITVLIYKLVLGKIALILYLIILALLFFIGLIASSNFSKKTGHSDPSFVVIDEVCGQLTALVLVPAEWRYLIIVFIVFRLFDIVKFFPLRLVEKLKGGLGIMADDIIAGILAGLIFRLVYVIL